MIMQSVYALADLVFIGRLGETAVAGLSICLQLFFVILALSRVLGTTVLARVSQLYGADRLEQAQASMSTLLLVALGLGLLGAGGAYLSVDTYVELFSDDAAVQDQGAIYLRITSLSFFTQVVAIVFGDGFRASGDFRTPMVVLAGSILLNILLDAVLIFGLGPIPALGIAGAAWATVISQLLAASIYALAMARPRGPRALRWRAPVWERGLVIEVVTRGLPAGLQFLSLSILMGLVLAAMKAHGPHWTAAAGAGFRVFQQMVLPIVAVAVAASAVAGQNYGAGEHARVRRATWTATAWAAAYGAFACAFLFLAARPLGHIFAESDAGLDAAEAYFHWTAPTLIAAISIVPTFVLQALGHAVLPLSAVLMRIGVLMALLFIAIPRLALGPAHVFGASSLSAVIECAMSFALLYILLHRRSLERES